LRFWVYKAFSARHIEIPTVIEEHNAIPGSIAKRSATAASDLMGQHMDEASESLHSPRRGENRETGPSSVRGRGPSAMTLFL
jgi:DNA-binding FadR family transcriptional regulator